VSPGALAGALRRRRARGERARTALHEVRGPLCAVELAVALSARQGRLPAERARAIELELARARRALSELEECHRPRGRRVPTSSPPLVEVVDLAELLSDSCEAWRAQAELHGRSLLCRWLGPRAYCLGDRVRLAQVSGNLIANALEHGAGTVLVEGELILARRALARIAVSDEGPGLPGAVMTLARRSATARRFRPGVASRGRGLEVVLGIVAAHGGRLGAAPCERGARLVVELPACAGSSAASGLLA
jgi:signal transduction histidine kinase